MVVVYENPKREDALKPCKVSRNESAITTLAGVVRGGDIRKVNRGGIEGERVTMSIDVVPRFFIPDTPLYQIKSNSSMIDVFNRWVH